eukprot:13944042-Alexandrium_andersonii.AAC.1
MSAARTRSGDVGQLASDVLARLCASGKTCVLFAPTLAVDVLGCGCMILTSMLEGVSSSLACMRLTSVCLWMIRLRL